MWLDTLKLNLATLRDAMRETHLAGLCRLLVHEVHEGPRPPDVGEGYLAQALQLGVGGVLCGRPACWGCVP